MATSVEVVKMDELTRGLAKVVDGAEVEYLSREGWRLVRVLEETHTETIQESVPFVVPGQSYTTQGCGTKGFLVTKNRFLMVLEKSSAIAKLSEEAKQQHILLSDMRTKLTELESDKKTLTAAHQKLLDSEKSNIEALGRLRGQTNEQRTRADRMELDIGKIRAAVGELKMKEILGQ